MGFNSTCKGLRRSDEIDFLLKSLFRVAQALIGPCPKLGDSHNGLAKDLDMAPFLLVNTEFSKDRSGLL
jgi:hypothetical protein